MRPWWFLEYEFGRRDALLVLRREMRQHLWHVENIISHDYGYYVLASRKSKRLLARISNHKMTRTTRRRCITIWGMAPAIRIHPGAGITPEQITEVLKREN